MHYLTTNSTKLTMSLPSQSAACTMIDVAYCMSQSTYSDEWTSCLKRWLAYADARTWGTFRCYRSLNYSSTNDQRQLHPPEQKVKLVHQPLAFQVFTFTSSRGDRIAIRETGRQLLRSLRSDRWTVQYDWVALNTGIVFDSASHDTKHHLLSATWFGKKQCIDCTLCRRTVISFWFLVYAAN